MTFKFRCPACGKQLSATEALVGKQKSCPRCRTKFTVPSPEQADARSSTAEEPAAHSSEHPSLLLPAKDNKHEDLIDMTAMVDIVFFLLIFFLVTSMQALESVINLPTPQASSAAASRSVSEISKDPAYLNVQIEEGDRIYIGEEKDPTVSELEVRSKLRSAKAKDPELRGMLVTGSPEASHGTFVMVVDAGADAGLAELLFTVPEQAE